jgi:pyruvate dehydrogenase E2 component (dihydrolipoamide acetyltransferase)
MADFVMPALGADMEAGTLVEWLVAPGDHVDRGQIVAVVETQKGAIDVEIYEAGVIEALVVPVGMEVPVGTVLARLRTEGEPATAAATVAAPSPAPSLAPSPVPPVATAAARAVEPSASVRALPRARRLAASLGVDLGHVTGTGPDGVITGEDVERAAAPPSPSAAPSPAPVPVSASAGMREAIAAAMARSKREIPHYYLGHVVDMEPVLARITAANAARSPAERILPIAVFVRALALSLLEFPELSGWFREGRFEPAPRPHVGVAVSLRGGGLVAPAVHDADRGSVGELMGRIRDVIGRARAGGLRASELRDATITLTSLGDQGVDHVFGVIHPPQVAIVGFGTIAQRPFVVEGEVRPRRVVEITLSADHRVSDGHRGARFVARLQQLLHTIEVP